MSLDDVPRCRHIKINGVQCGSPALRRRRYCFFHNRMLDAKKRFAEKHLQPRPFFSMCLLEDANAVQVALMQVLQLLGSGQMDHKTAGLMLYGLQTASANVRHTDFEAEIPTDIVIDRDTVAQTGIHGPQWFEEDFEDPSDAESDAEAPTEDQDEDQDEDEVADDAEEDAGDEGQEAAHEELTSEAVAKLPPQPTQQITLQQARMQVQSLARNWLLQAATGKAEAKPG
jgi:hypothetical protein